MIQAIGRLQFRGFRSSRGCNAELVMSVSGTMIDLVIEVEIINRVRRHLSVSHSQTASSYSQIYKSYSHFL